MKALVMDDSVAARFMIGKILKEIGFSFVEAADGSEGLKQLYGNPDLDLVLIDWNMPVMTGIEFIREARKNPPKKLPKLVVVTTETEMTKVVEAIECGADEYVMKPFSKEMLVDKLRLVGLVS